MIIRHALPTRKFTKIDRFVFSNRALSDGAVRLYGYLCGLRNGANFNDAYIIKALDMSRTVLGRRKKELKDNGLLLIEQLGPRVYVGYIGYTEQSAEEVKNRWEMEEDKINNDIINKFNKES